MLPTLKNNAAAGYQGPVKIKLLKGAGLLGFSATSIEIRVPFLRVKVDSGCVLIICCTIRGNIVLQFNLTRALRCT